MKKDIAVIVKEQPTHVVEVRNGVMGKRGPKGDDGPIGLRGPEGRSKELDIVINNNESISVSGLNHGIMYMCGHDNAEVIINVGESIFVEDDGEKEKKGAVILFTQVGSSQLVFNKAQEVEIIIPKYCVNRCFGIGCSVGLVSKDRYTWVLVGDLATAEVIVDA